MAESRQAVIFVTLYLVADNELFAVGGSAV